MRSRSVAVVTGGSAGVGRATAQVEVRVPGVLRVHARRAPPRGQQRQSVHGPPPSREHPAVRLVRDNLGSSPPTGPADPPAGGGGVGHRRGGPRRPSLQDPGILGSWNKALMVAGQLAPGFANQYAALGAWDTQLTAEPIAPDHPVNLRAPADDTSDRGARGIFDSKGHGVLDPDFLRRLPHTARTFARALGRRVAERRDP